MCPEVLVNGSVSMAILKQRELDEWFAFQSRHRSDFVRERDPLQIEKAAIGQKAFVLRDALGEICGTCAVLEYDEDGLYREVGSVRITVNGWGLQTVMMAAALVSEWTFDPTPLPHLAITAIDNEGSIKSIGRAGFRKVEDLEPGRWAAMGAQKSSAKVYFLAPDTSLLPNQALLRAIVRDGGIRRGAHTLNLRMDIPIVTEGVL